MSEEIEVSITLRDAEYIYDYIWDMPASAIKDNILGKIYKWDRKRTPPKLPLNVSEELSKPIKIHPSEM